MTRRKSRCYRIIAYAKSRCADRFTAVASHQAGEITDANVGAEQAHGAVAEREVGSAGMKGIRLAASFAAIIRMRERRAAKVVAVGAVDRAWSGERRAVIASAIDAEIGAGTNPAAAVHSVA